MSIALDPVNLGAATVGTTGELDWTNQFQTGAPLGVRAGRPTLRLYNESGCGVKFDLGTRSDRLPAGGWIDVQLNGERSLDYVVEYVLPGQPVSLLLGTIYEPGERVPPIPTLGNSPIGIGGTVATSNSNILKNDANSPATEFIEATPSDQAASSVALNNDASGFLKILSAGVLRVILSAIRGDATTTKASVQLGDAGDTSVTTLYGTLGAGSVVPVATINGVLPVAQMATGYPAADINGTVANANQIAGNLGAKNIGSSPANKPTLETNKTGGSTYDFYVETWDGAAAHDALLVDHTGLRYSDAAGIAGVLPAAQVGSGYPGADVSGAVASATTATSATSATSATTATNLSGSINASQVNPGTFPTGEFDIKAGNVVGAEALILWSGNVTGGYGHALMLKNGADNTCESIFGIGDFSQSPFGFGTWLYDQKNNNSVFTGVSSERTVAKRGPLAQMTTNGGGAAGNRLWEGTTDPGANAGEGDWWAPA